MPERRVFVIVLGLDGEEEDNTEEEEPELDFYGKAPIPV
uniref:Uncharacterized protein n=1 Tax=Heterorhabditis bacteriophora TaxID=37862 RepID=A0A1I7X949_HETBA